MTRILDAIELDYSDVLLLPNRSVVSSRSEVDLSRTFKFKSGGSDWTGIPIIGANMDGVATFEMARALKTSNLMLALNKHYTKEQLIKFYSEEDSTNVFYSLGVVESDYTKFKEVSSVVGHIDKVCIDAANFYTELALNFLKRFVDAFPNTTILVGNVVSGNIVEELLLNGASIVKVGIGPSRVCMTRSVSGVGRPQLSAVLDCVNAAHNLGGYICADGGITSPGQASISFGAGSDFLMLGSMFSGHDEGGGEVIDGKVKFWGMSSDTAMELHTGTSVKDYRASEGRTVYVDYKGPVDTTVRTLLGGIRSAGAYIGAKTLKDFPKCATFVRVNRQLDTSWEAK